MDENSNEPIIKHTLNQSCSNQSNSEKDVKVLINNFGNEEIITDAIRDNYDKLNRIYNIFEIAFLISIISSQIMMFGIFFFSMNEMPFYAVGILGIVTLISVIVFVNLYIRMKVLLDNVKGNRSLNIGVILTYTCFNIAAFNVLIFLVLLNLKESIYSMNNLSMTVISIPLYLAIGLGFFYFFFMLPVLLTFNLWAEIVLYALSLVSALALITLIDIKIDSNKNSWLTVSFPVLAIMLYYIIYSILSFLEQPKEERNEIGLIIQLTGQMLLILGAILYFLSKERKILLKSIFPIGLIVLSFLIITVEKLYEWFKSEEDIDNSTTEEEEETMKGL